MNRRKICIITGTRAEFGLLKPVMEKIRQSPSLELQVIATGTHLLEEYGKTVLEIERGGFHPDACVPMIMAGNDKTSMSLSIGMGIISFTQVLNILNPEIVVVLGDRFEIFSAAVAASFSGRVVAHISGGDSLQAGYDEYVRHAVTKISHIHFPSTGTSAQRIINLGEDPAYVFIAGSTALDTILKTTAPLSDNLCRKYGLVPKEQFALVIQHPISTAPSESQKQIRITLDAILDLGLRMIVIYPNVDPGGKLMIDVIQQYRSEFPDRILVYKSLPFEDYLGIMRIASVMIGNSSSGIIESSSFHLPVVNIGERQKGREKAANVLDVPHDKEKIKDAIKTALYDENFRKSVMGSTNPYGDGHASERIVKELENVDITPELLKKRITY